MFDFCVKCECSCEECNHPEKTESYCTSCKNGALAKNGKCGKAPTKKWTATVSDTYDKITFTVDGLVKFWAERGVANAFGNEDIYSKPRCGEKMGDLRFRDN